LDFALMTLKIFSIMQIIAIEKKKKVKFMTLIMIICDDRDVKIK
jgi:hypothetical protein